MSNDIPQLIDTSKWDKYDSPFISDSVFVHEPTGIRDYSIANVNEKLKRHYQKIIDSQIRFTHVMKFK